MLQTLRINSKLRQQQQQTHYNGKKERESFLKKPPKLSFLLKETLQSCRRDVSAAMLGATSSPPAPCSTPRPKGDGGRQDSECKIAKRRPKTVAGISSRWGGSTHREPKPTARRDLCGSGQDKLKVSVLQELPWRTGRPPKLSGKRCCWPLLQW